MSNVEIVRERSGFEEETAKISNSRGDSNSGSRKRKRKEIDNPIENVAVTSTESVCFHILVVFSFAFHQNSFGLRSNSVHSYCRL